MKRGFKKYLIVSIGLLTSFILWTVSVCFIDVSYIGPNNSAVGFSTVNGFVHRFTGVNWTLYTLTDWLSLVPVGICAGFGILGLFQWIKKKSIRKVDFDIIALGIFYTAVIAVYVLFEIIVINRRPVLIDGYLEVSYPSSTTLLFLTVMPTALMQFNMRIKKRKAKILLSFFLTAFTFTMVLFRLISGVHWFTDIVGGVLISSSLVTMYFPFCKN